MPPRIKISREDILEKATDIVREQGIEALNARSVASELNCSVKPIFRAFNSMGDLRDAIIEKVTLEYNEYIKTEIPGESPFKATGINYIRFAKERSHIFRLLFMTERQINTNIYESSVESNKDFAISVIKSIHNLTDETANKMYIDMWLFAHGIATLLVTKTVKLEETQIIQMFSEVFSGLLKELKGVSK